MICVAGQFFADGAGLFHALFRERIGDAAIGREGMAGDFQLRHDVDLRFGMPHEEDAEVGVRLDAMPEIVVEMFAHCFLLGVDSLPERLYPE